MALNRCRGRSFLSLADYDGNEIAALLKVASELKAVRVDGRKLPPALAGTTMPMIFQKRSTRTRVSTETGMALLGGHAIFLSSDDIQLGVNETMADTGAVLGRMNDAIFARVNRHEHIENMHRSSPVPVINGLSDLHHPLQILADYQTMVEAFGHLKGLNVAWVGDSNNVLNSFLTSAAKMGINLTVAHPVGYEPRPDMARIAEDDAKTYKTRFEVYTSPEKAVKGANVIVTDTWVSMGSEDEKDKRLRDFAGFQVFFDFFFFILIIIFTTNMR